MRYMLLVLLMLIALSCAAADGMQVRTSDFSVNDTMNRLEQAVTQADFTVMARIDHGAAAKKVDLVLPPTELLIFGKPKAGTLLMQAGPTAGLDLPLKYLVWQGADGKVQIGWNDMAWVAARHGIEGQEKLLAKIGGVLSKFAEQAAKK